MVSVGEIKGKHRSMLDDAITLRPNATRTSSSTSWTQLASSPRLLRPAGRTSTPVDWCASAADAEGSRKAVCYREIPST